ncbi:MAG TPA: ABC transporter permease, partial [Firmicutes bacterium]|nr:ABC transporter permease [Bacillota bacterium]
PIIVVALVFLVLVLFLIYPIGKMLVMSFIEQDEAFAIQNLTFKNFSRFFTSKLYINAMLNSLKVSFSAVFFAILLGLPLAYIMSRIDIPGKTLFTSLAILPLILPPFVGSYSWILLLGKNGFITYVLNKLFGI